MTVPNHNEIIELATNGRLVEAVFSNHWGILLADEQHELTNVLAAVHNQGVVNLLALLNAGSLAPFDGWQRRQGQQVFQEAVTKLDVAAHAVLSALDALYEGDNEPVGGRIESPRVSWRPFRLSQAATA